MQNSTTQIWERHFGQVGAVPFGENVVGFFDELTQVCSMESMLAGRSPVCKDVHGNHVFVGSTVLFAEDYEQPNIYEKYVVVVLNGEIMLRSMGRPNGFEKARPISEARPNSLIFCN